MATAPGEAAGAAGWRIDIDENGDAAGLS